METALRRDIVVAGGGAAGLAFAIAVKSVAGPALTVTVCDPDAVDTAPVDPRAFAIVAGAVRFFEAIGAWPAMAADAEPMRAMEITDSSLEDIVRPLMLALDPEEEDSDGEAMAHMVPSATILNALRQRAQALGVEHQPFSVTSAAVSGSIVTVRAGEATIRAKLLVAADGRTSVLRQAAGIPAYGWRYNQTAIVGTMVHSLPHEGIAIQHFLPAGPFAMLPLKGGHRSSIVWSETPARAKALLAGDAEDLLHELNQRAAGRLGTAQAFENVQSFPLSIGIARSFIGDRLALLGDAAHGLHPLAGQGLNFGLRGAATLAETVIDAARLGLDIGSPAALAPYETSRRPDVMVMALATEGLNRLFSSDDAATRTVRDIGLGLAHRLAPLKRRVIRHAKGDGSLAPRAFRGEPI